MLQWHSNWRERLVCTVCQRRMLLQAQHYHNNGKYANSKDGKWKDWKLGPIPIEPQCFSYDRPDSQRPNILSAIINSNAKVPVERKGDKSLLKFSSIAAAKQRLDTVLQLHGLSRNVTLTDFKRLLPEGKHIPGWRSEGGLLEAFPMRNSKTLEKLDSWILAFSTPYHAALYHSRLLWFHQNAKLHTKVTLADMAEMTKERPSDKFKAIWDRDFNSRPPMISLPPNYVDPDTGEELWRRVQEYTIYPPRQKPKIDQFIPPFKDNVLNNLWWHHQWTKPDNQGRVAYPVMISLSPTQKWFSGPIIWNLIKKDSERSGVPWEVFDGPAGILRMFYATYETGSPSDLSVYESDAAGFRDPTTLADMPMDRNKWMIRFRGEDEAKRFIRKWNRTLWNAKDDEIGEEEVFDPNAMLMVEQLW